MVLYVLPILKKTFSKERPVLFKIIIAVSGVLFFLVIFPGLLYLAGRWVDSLIAFQWSSWVRFVMGAVFVPMGLFFAGWSTVSQWRMTGGVPDPGKSPDVFIILGPYSYCRNPFLLGLMFFYLGLGTVLVSVTAGFTALILCLLTGTLCFKRVEEKQWEKRFGEEYARYRERTSYLFPGSINWI